MKSCYLLFLLCISIFSGIAQSGKFVRFTSAHAPFPDPERQAGHTYNSVFYDASGHYQDSSVLLYIPSNFKPGQHLELVVWFHGWNNNIDSANRFFRLSEQFDVSGRNAILVFPEGPKNAPDSYGGKLEKSFEPLMQDVLQQLKQHKLILTSIQYPLHCSVSLAGHSGAYRVISRILALNKIDEVILFDAMYGSNEAYLKWISENPSHRFIHIYTKNGGTFDNTKAIIRQLKDSLHTEPLVLDEATMNPHLLQSAQPIFIFSDQEHNEVITHNNNWELFLKSRSVSNK